MKKVYLLLNCCLLTAPLLAQNNYIVNTANNATAGLNNVSIGLLSGNLLVGKAGQNNGFFGFQAGQNNTDGSFNSFIGSQAGLNNKTGNYNVFIGSSSGYTNQTGTANLFLGQLAGFANLSGSYNTFIGSSSGQNNSIGQNNNFIGNGAGLANTEGNFNVFIGSEAGSRNLRGGSNVHIGGFAGKENLDGSFNTFLGHNANVPSGVTLNNVTVIGYNAQATAPNSVILGSNANVGIGNTAPGNKLEITANTENSSGLRFTKLTNNSTQTVGLTISAASPVVKVLTVDPTGNVILAGLSVNTSGLLSGIDGGRVASDLWTKDGDAVVAEKSPVRIGDNFLKAPKGYKLYVAEGILTEKVKVAVKNSSEWSDYVFAPEYRLRSLAEVEQHIQQNGHLPGVPSAQQMVEQGNDLHKTDAKLLEKIEELTLYSIELEKANKQEKQRNQDQQERIEKLEQLVQQLLRK